MKSRRLRPDMGRPRHALAGGHYTTMRKRRRLFDHLVRDGESHPGDPWVPACSRLMSAFAVSKSPGMSKRDRLRPRCPFRYGIAATPSTREAESNAALYFACLAGSNGCQSVAPLASSHSSGYSSKIWILLASAYCSRFEMSIWP